MWFGLGGSVYGFLLTLWGILNSGGGHFNLPIVLATSPIWFGVLFWPLWGMLSVDFRTALSKTVFLVTVGMHYVGIFVYWMKSADNEKYWLHIGNNDPIFILLNVLFTTVYLSGQIYLWTKFLREKKQSRSGAPPRPIRSQGA